MNANLTALFAALSEPVVVERDGAVSYCNDAAEARYPGMRPGRPVAHFLPSELLEQKRRDFTIWTAQGAFHRAVLEDTTVYVLLSAPTDGRDLLGAAGERLRQSLSLLQVACGGLESWAGDLGSREVADYTAKATKSLFQMLRMANHMDILSGEEPPAAQKRLFALDRLLKETVDNVRLITAQDLRFSTALKPDAMLLADPEQLQQALLNLLDNAVKFAPGKPVFVALSSLGSRYCFTVTDSGGSEDSSADRFFAHPQVGGGRRNPSQGMGLGLSASARLLQANGGTLMVEQLPDAGVRVTVSLPIPPASVPSERLVLREDAPPYVSRNINLTLEELSDILDSAQYLHFFSD